MWSAVRFSLCRFYRQNWYQLPIRVIRANFNPEFFFREKKIVRNFFASNELKWTNAIFVSTERKKKEFLNFCVHEINLFSSERHTATERMVKLFLWTWIIPDTFDSTQHDGYIWIFDELDEFISSGNRISSIGRCLDLRDFQRKGKLSLICLFTFVHVVWKRHARCAHNVYCLQNINSERARWMLCTHEPVNAIARQRFVAQRANGKTKITSTHCCSSVQLLGE